MTQRDLLDLGTAAEILGVHRHPGLYGLPAPRHSQTTTWRRLARSSVRWRWRTTRGGAIGPARRAHGTWLEPCC